MKSKSQFGPRLEPGRNWRVALLLTVVLRIFYTSVGAVGAIFLHPTARLIESNAFTQDLGPPGRWQYLLLGIWDRFDTTWYLHIAQHGYDIPAAVVFYPLYPSLIRGLSGILGPMASALLISTVAAFFYFWGLLRLADQEFSDSGAITTAVLAAAWPASFFLFTGYTEAVALALIVWSIGWARNECWFLSAMSAFAAGLTRSAGTLLIVPLAIMAWRARGHARWSVALAPLGTLGYWLWLRETHRPSVVIAYRSYWKTGIDTPVGTLWQAIRSFASGADPLVAFGLVALIFFFIAGVIARRRAEDRWFSLAVIAHLLLRIAQPPLLGAPRYLLPVYPALLTTAEQSKKIRRQHFVFLCIGLFALNLGLLWAFLSWSLVL